MTNPWPLNGALIGFFGSSIFTAIVVPSFQWNLKKPPIILLNSGHVPTWLSGPSCAWVATGWLVEPPTAGVADAGAGGGASAAERAGKSACATRPLLSASSLPYQVSASPVNSSRLNF